MYIKKYLLTVSLFMMVKCYDVICDKKNLCIKNRRFLYDKATGLWKE